MTRFSFRSPYATSERAVTFEPEEPHEATDREYWHFGDGLLDLLDGIRDFFPETRETAAAVYWFIDGKQFLVRPASDAAAMAACRTGEAWQLFSLSEMSQQAGTWLASEGRWARSPTPITEPPPARPFKMVALYRDGVNTLAISHYGT